MTAVTSGLLWVDNYTSGNNNVPGGSYNGSSFSGVVIEAGGTWAGSHVVGSGGTITLYNNGALTGNVVLNGGHIASYNKISGNQNFSWGASGGTLELRQGAIDYGESPLAGSAVITVSSGATIQSTALQSGNLMTVKGSAISAIVSSGATLTFTDGGSGSYTSLGAGGTLNIGSGTVYDNQHTTSLTAVSGARINVLSGGVLSNADAGNLGAIIVSAGGSAASAIVSSGGGLGIQGTALNTVVKNGGVVEIASGGSAVSNTVTSGGSIQVDSGGTVATTTVSSGGSVTVRGTATSTTISSGATLTFTDGGSGTYTALNAGGTLNIGSGTVYNNQHTTSLTAVSGARINVLSGGILSNSDVGNLGAIIVSAGGSAAGVVLSNGGGLGVQGTALNTVVNKGAVIEVASGGSVVSNTVNSGGFIQVDSGGTVGTTTVSSGGSVNVASGASISGVLTIQNAGSATVWNTASGTVDLQGDTNGGLVISGLASGGTLNTVISGFSGTAAGNSDSIELVGVKAADVTAVTYQGTDQVTLALANGNTIVLNIVGVSTRGFALTDGRNGWLDYEVCFLSGSMIQTPEGDVAVEDIRMGDTVVSYAHGTAQTATVSWAGKAHAVVRPELMADEAGYPVRILANAIAEGVPYKDLLITPEHSLFFDGRFVPARMLVNGSSILYDKSITSYDYYHIETEQHSVIRADGMLTESYLDTGNRRAFQQEGGLVSLHGANRSWENDAAAVLCVEREFVEPVYQKIKARAEELYEGVSASSLPEVTTDPDLHLVTQQGATLRPVRHENGQYSFMLPPNTDSVRIVSRASRPADTIGPFVDDRRLLGVAVGTVTLVTSNGKLDIIAHLRANKPAGWHAEAEGSQSVWTNGNAVLPLVEKLSCDEIRLLSLSIHAAGPYLLAEDKQADARIA